MESLVYHFPYLFGR